jgi:hypothetical protein
MPMMSRDHVTVSATAKNLKKLLGVTAPIVPDRFGRKLNDAAV